MSRTLHGILLPVIVLLLVQPLDSWARSAIVADYPVGGVTRSDTTGVRINHMSPIETPVNNQIWSVKESGLGWAFFAEEEGILALRGEDWQLIPTPSASTVRSLAVERSLEGETLYFGEQEDFGYVKVDSSGIGRAISLRHLAPDTVTFGNVWNVHVVKNNVVFQTRNHLFVKGPLGFSVIFSDRGFHNAFVAGERYLVREFGVGLKYLQNGELRLVGKGDVLREDMIAGVTELSPSTALIWTQANGILTYDLGANQIRSSTPYPNELRGISSEYRLYTAVELDDNRYIIATLGGGLLIVDNQGYVLKRLTRESGFPDDSQNYLQPSMFGGLWVGLDNEGVAYLDSDLVRVSYSSEDGITGYINDIDVINGHLVVSTGSGVYQNATTYPVFSGEDYFYSTTSAKPVFERVEDTPIVWSVEAFQDQIYLSSESGVKRVTSFTHPEESITCSGLETDRSRLPLQAFGFFVEENSTNLFVGLSDGLGLVHDDGAGCSVKTYDLGIEDVEVRSIDFFDGRLWLGTAYHGFLALEFDQGFTQIKTVLRSFDHAPGRNDVFVSAGRLFGYNSSGVFDLIIRDGAIESSEVNGPVRRINSISVASWQTAQSGWLVTNDQVIELGLLHGQLEVVSEPSSLRFEKSSTSSVFADSTGVVWFNNGSELIRYDPKYDVPGNKVFNAHVASVKKASDGETLFNGFFRAKNGGIATLQPEWAVPVVDFDSRNLTFLFSATEFINPEAVEYRYRIDGNDSGAWTEWSDEREAMTSSIEEGSYTIVVQAKDEIGRLSETASYSFVILPPWYRTIWAYLAYVVFGVSALLSGRKYIHMRRAHKMAAEQAKELEREREVVKRLSEANDRLTQANKLKDEFLATTSHELRTPLTAILGFTSVLKDEIPEEADYREFLDIIEDSGSRLMDTLNSLLDLAKLRAGIMEVNLEPVDLYQQTFQEVVQLQSAAQKKGVKLKVRRPEVPLYAVADVYGLNRILHNLVGNAIKFTDEGMIEVWFDDKVDRIELHVTDTGIGIEAEFLPELFNAFIQESDGLSRTYEGTGLGLAITSGIVQLMDADIRVSSEKGIGSDFVVTMTKASAPRQRPRRVSGMGNTASA